MLGWRNNRFAHVLVGNRYRCLTRKWRATGKHFVKQYSCGIKIGASIYVFATGLLWAEVLRSSNDAVGVRLGDRRFAHRASDSKVHHLHQPGVGNHHVGGLDVAVNHPGKVRKLKGGKHALGITDRLGDAQLALVQ